MARVEVRGQSTGPFAQVGDVTQGFVQEVAEELALHPALCLRHRPAKEQQECSDERRSLEGALVVLVELVLGVQQQRPESFGPGRDADRPPVVMVYRSTRGSCSAGQRRDVDAQGL